MYAPAVRAGRLRSGVAEAYRHPLAAGDGPAGSDGAGRVRAVVGDDYFLRRGWRRARMRGRPSK
jgi:hypothetical protein